MRGILIAAIAGLVAAVCGPALAGCTNTDPDRAHAATVTGGDKRVYFVQDSFVQNTGGATGCPNASIACRTRAYVTPGDIVLVTIDQGAYSCASFTNTRGVTTTNWLPSAALAPITPQSAGIKDWLGHWVRVEAEITVMPAGSPGELSVKGAATYGAADPDRVRTGGVNMGDIDAVVKPVAGHLAFTTSGDATLPYDQGAQDDCRVRMSLIGPYLLVADNQFCGGHNVSFSGIYRRGK